MRNRKRIAVIIGTRPEAIKLAPVVLDLAEHADALVTRVILSGQHAHLVGPVLDLFDIEPHRDLEIMTHAQSLADLTARALHSLDGLLEDEQPDLILVQGDTTTVFAAALAAFYRGVPVGHVEAGLRTGDMRQPFPEEMNRRAAALVTDLHFAPTPRAKAALLSEGVRSESVFVTGNTVADALRLVLERAPGEPSVIPLGRTSRRLLSDLLDGDDFLLVEVHRRENIPEGVSAVCQAVHRAVADLGLQALVSVHPNPKVREIMLPALQAHDGVHLLEPMDYPTFVGLAARARVILTDSGGLQEEAPSFGTPVVVARNHTERPEASDAGLAKIAGADADALANAVAEFHSNPLPRPAPGETLPSPYGDGRAAARISQAVLNYFGEGERPADYAPPV